MVQLMVGMQVVDLVGQKVELKVDKLVDLLVDVWVVDWVVPLDGLKVVG